MSGACQKPIGICRRCRQQEKKCTRLSCSASAATAERRFNTHSFRVTASGSPNCNKYWRKNIFKKLTKSSFLVEFFPIAKQSYIKPVCSGRYFGPRRCELKGTILSRWSQKQASFYSVGLTPRNAFLGQQPKSQPFSRYGGRPCVCPCLSTSVPCLSDGDNHDTSL